MLVNCKYKKRCSILWPGAQQPGTGIGRDPAGSCCLGELRSAEWPGGLGAIGPDARSRPPSTGCTVRPVPLRSAWLRGQSRTQSGTGEPESPGSNYLPGPSAGV